MIPNRESDAGPAAVNECPACHQADVRVDVCQACDKLCCTECAFVGNERLLCQECNKKAKEEAEEKRDCEDWLWEAEYTLLHRRNRSYSETIAMVRDELNRAEAKSNKG